MRSSLFMNDTTWVRLDAGPGHADEVLDGMSATIATAFGTLRPPP